MMNFIYQILLSIGSAILYRLGGSSKVDQDKEFPWISRWFKNIPKKRDVMSNIIKLFALSLLGITGTWYAWFLAFGLLWASLSTYYDELFGYDNFWFHGFTAGASLLPLVIWGNLGLIPFIVQAIGLGIIMGGWSKLVDEVIRPLRSDIWSELGRGFFLTISNILIKLF